MRCAALILTAAILAAAEPASDPARDAFVAAVSAAPEVAALHERAWAARRQEAAAGRLADPMLSAGWSRKRLAAGAGYDPMYELMLEQSIPRWGERDAARLGAAAMTAMAGAEADDTAAMLASDVAMALAEAEGARARVHQGEGRLARGEAVAQVVASRVASGAARVGEQLTADTVVAQARFALEQARRDLADREADVRGRLGLAPDAALPPFAAPDPAAVAASEPPAARIAQARGVEAAAMTRDAEASRLPETAVGVRVSRELMDEGHEDTIGLTLSVSLPVWSAASANEDAARARARAARREAAGARLRATAAIAAAERAARVAASARTLATGTLARIEAEREALMRSLGSGGTGVVELLDLLDRQSDGELQVIEAETAARSAQAALWRFAPPDIAGTEP